MSLLFLKLGLQERCTVEFRVDFWLSVLLYPYLSRIIIRDTTSSAALNGNMGVNADWCVEAALFNWSLFAAIVASSLVFLGRLSSLKRDCITSCGQARIAICPFHFDSTIAQSSLTFQAT